MGTLAKVFGSEVETMAAQAEGQLGETVLAAGRLKQGKRPSMVAMVTGTALLAVLRPKRSKSLPRSFVLALTPTRVVAFGFVGVSDDDGENYRAVLRNGVRGSWAPEAVALSGPVADGSHDFVLRIGGEEVPITRVSTIDDPETDALVAKLSA